MAKPGRTIGDIFDDGKTIERAVKRAVRDVVGPRPAKKSPARPSRAKGSPRR